MPSHHEIPKYIPTPQEIAEGTAKIRAAWSDEEHARRLGVDLQQLQRWYPPDTRLGPGMRQVRIEPLNP